MGTRLKRIFLIVLDGCGVGALPDAAEYGDVGANTLGNTARAVGGLNLPNLSALGFGAIHPSIGLPVPASPTGFYGKMSEIARGKDTATGHWEIMGVVTDTVFKTFPKGFPPALIDTFCQKTGRGVLGNKPASGTEIIQELGERHQETGDLIVYTSADSVFQIAAHEDTVPLETLYRYCEIAYDLVTPKGVARVIARPFTGTPGRYTRTENRHDYTVPPPSRTVMQSLDAAGIPVTGVGKIRDIYAGAGVTHHVKATNNHDIIERTIELAESDRQGLIFANLVDFDMLYGHRRDPEGFAGALKAFDDALPRLLNATREGDLVIMTADHGNDPTAPGSDHSREYVPLLVFNSARQSGGSLGIRDSFADIGATIAEAFDVKGPEVGSSFLNEVI